MRDAMLTSSRRRITSSSRRRPMIVLTGADGRTTRLSPDGKKIKDENTKIGARRSGTAESW
jgi:hypothetical protein